MQTEPRLSLWFSDLICHSVGKQNGVSEIYHVGHDVGDETVVSVNALYGLHECDP